MVADFGFHIDLSTDFMTPRLYNEEKVPEHLAQFSIGSLACNSLSKPSKHVRAAPSPPSQARSDVVSTETKSSSPSLSGLSPGSCVAPSPAKPAKKHKIVLHVDKTKQRGILTLRHLYSVRVSVIHISSKGDALVNDGKKAMMIPADSVQVVNEEEDVAGRRRLEFVKKIYETLRSGGIVDTAAIYLEVQKWLL